MEGQAGSLILHSDPKLALLRHGPTEWNAQKRIQGSVDTPLSMEGTTLMSGLVVPEAFATARVYCSPKLRARQTAECLGLKNPIFDARLVEQNWGEWEGMTRAEMLARDGDDAFERAGASRGLEFRPPRGESTGEVHARVADFFRDVAAKNDNAIAVAHAGVLRAAYALATGWELSGPMPPQLDLKAVLVLSLTADGMPTLEALNLPMRARESL